MVCHKGRAHAIPLLALNRSHNKHKLPCLRLAKIKIYDIQIATYKITVVTYSMLLLLIAGA